MSEGTTSRLPIWLIVSLMANALLIGLIIGGGLGQRKAGPAAGPAIGNEQTLMRGIDQAVSIDQRDEVRRAFRRAFADTRTERVRLQQARRDLGRLLSAADYDAAAVEAGFAELRAADDAMKARLHRVLTEQFGTLSAEQRRLIIRDFSRRGAGERFRDRRRPGGERPPPPRRPIEDQN